ncbi:PP2C family protein-serine/threonine phosphatase [Thalassoglobus polymorphus]|uniref:PPM-type phosphatase domain-containing protein n=1 Tax=Thalassoglobus polymorphus TaxID=2527994 RepID=A0A517QRM4_9PLAN|nr:protein phosphatase 2C domain-containing protein [Thalassoglobus polymorphus]QDT34267.1 Putative protein phosphatase 2C-type [Thalassoglobus polymorphus]
MFWEQKVQVAVETHIGLRRKNNEDSACFQLCQDEEQWRKRGHLFVVADGMGGHAVGELASRIAIETLPHAFFKTTEKDVRSTLQEAVTTANEAIYQRGSTNEDFLHMGTTCTSLTLCPRGAMIAHVGDSRAYRVRRDRIDQLTFDHSLEWELERRNQSLIGVVDMSKHRNIITRSLGPEENVEVDIEGPYPVIPGDTFVLCTDGLSNQVSDEEIGAIARELSPSRAAKLLIHLANVRGGPDNSTVIVARVGDLPANVQPVYVEEEIDDTSNLDWSWFIGFSIAALALVSGLWMLLFNHPTKGAITTVVAVLGFLALAIGAYRKQRELLASTADDSQLTKFLRPHRTAVCLDSKNLCELLSAIEIDLRRAAQEDGWSVNWKEHKNALEGAGRAVQEKRYSRGVRNFANAIGEIMDEHPIRSGN